MYAYKVPLHIPAAGQECKDISFKMGVLNAPVILVTTLALLQTLTYKSTSVHMNYCFVFNETTHMHYSQTTVMFQMWLLDCTLVEQGS